MLGGRSAFGSACVSGTRHRYTVECATVTGTDARCAIRRSSVADSGRRDWATDDPCLENPVDFHNVATKGCTSAAGCKGDQLIGKSRMLDADTRVDVGSLAVTCTLMDPSKSLYHCPANTISLTGRGQIVFDETVYIGGPWYPKPWPIISGSGEFLGATGTVISPKDSTWSYGDFVITITK